MKNGSVNIWMNLIGFDKNDEDRGVNRFLNTTGSIPDSVIGLLCHSDFFHLHKGMDEEYILPPDNCAYWGVPRNLERERQEWTNYDLRQLVRGLKERGVDFYAGIFGSYLGSAFHEEWVDSHPEIFRHALRGGYNPKASIFVLKRFSDGSYYEDFFIEKAVQTLTDYEMTGLHLADSFCPPAGGMLHNLDFSTDFVLQFIEHSGIALPEYITKKLGTDTEEAERERGEWIYRNERLAWIEFNAWRWERFFRKLCRALHKIDKKVLVLGMYCTDPLETLYCIGLNLRRIVEAGVDKITANILPTSCYIAGPDFRPYKFYEYMSIAPTVAAHLPKGHLLSMLGVQDATEEWNAIYDRPVMHQKDMYTMMSYQLIDKDGVSRCLDGFFLCLGDGLSSDDWKWENERLESALSATPCKLFSPVMLWSEAANEALLPEYIKTRRWSPHKFYCEIERNGLRLGGSILPEAMNEYKGTIFVPNFDLLTKEEQKTVEGYKGGAILATASPDFDTGSVDGVTFAMNDPYSAYPMKAFLIGKELSDETKEAVQELLSEDDGKESLVGDLTNIAEPDYTLTEALVFQKVTKGFVKAICLILGVASESPFKIDKPSVIMGMPDGAYRLYIFNDSEDKYHRAFVVSDRGVKNTRFISKYPILPPKFMDAPSSSLHHIYRADAKDTSFQVKIQPGGVTIMDVYLEDK